MADEERISNQPADQMPAQPLPVPMFYGSSIQLMWTANDCTILLSRPRPALMGVDRYSALAEAVAAVQVSPQTAKDLLLLLQETVASYERDWGEIKTEYQRSKAK